MKNHLAEICDDGDLHIYINSDEFTNANNAIVVSYDGKQLAYALETTDDKKNIDWLMGLLGRDTQNWFHKNIVIHWGVNTWKFYNARNVSLFDKENIEFFDIKDFDVE